MDQDTVLAVMALVANGALAVAAFFVAFYGMLLAFAGLSQARPVYSWHISTVFILAGLAGFVAAWWTWDQEWGFLVLVPFQQGP